MFPVRGGNRHFSAEEEGRAQIDVTIRRDRLDPPLLLSLEKSAAIDLAVFFPPDEDTLFSVWIAADPGWPIDSEWFLAHAQSGSYVSAKLDPESEEPDRPIGTTTFEPLDPGTYWVGAGRTSSRVDQLGSVTVAEGERVSLRLDVPPPPQESTVEVHVFDANGLPHDDPLLEVVAVSPEADGSRRRISIGSEERTIGDGARLLILDEIGEAFLTGARVGELLLLVDADGYVEQEYSIEGHRVDVFLPQTSSLEVRVQGIAEDEEVYLIVANPQGQIITETWFWDESAEVLEPLLQGELVLYLLDEESESLVADPVRYTLGSGAGRLALQISHRYELAVRVPQSFESTLPAGFDLKFLTLHAVEPRVTPTWVSPMGAYLEEATGMYRFDRVPAGEYFLQLYDGGMSFRAMRVEIDRDREVVYDPRPFRAFRVVGTPGADCPLRSGDRVIGVEGEKFRNSAMMNLFQVALWNSSLPLHLLIERDGAEVEVVLPPGEVREQLREEVRFRPDMTG